MRTAHITSAKREVRYGRSPGGSSRVLDALSCYLSLILKHFHTKQDTKKKKSMKIKEGDRCAPPGCATAKTKLLK